MFIDTIIIWIDPNIHSEENQNYLKELKSNGVIKIQCYDNYLEAIDYIKQIKFEETVIIVNGEIYNNFIKIFKENCIYINLVPKIIIWNKNKKVFMKNNNINTDIYHHFYNFEIKSTFDEIKKLLINPINNNIIVKSDENVRMTFQYIENKEQLTLPLMYKTLIEICSNDIIENYTNSLFKNYKDNYHINELLKQIINIKDIPLELLSKYYIRAYTIESNFYKDLNKDLQSNNLEKHKPFIKVLYEGIKLKSLPLGSDNILYRGSKISNKELKKIKIYMSKKIEGLPAAIVFSNSFLSFTKEKAIAEGHIKNKNYDNKISNVLYILEKNKDVDYKLATHGDIDELSKYPEREVLFFPFSCFEIKEIKEVKMNGETRYEIKLLYLTKYLKDIINDQNLKEEKEIPESKFKNQLINSGLIKNKKIEKQNIKYLIKQYKKYTKILYNPSFIIGEININLNDVNKEIRIINSYEEIKRYKPFEYSNYMTKNIHYINNENEIKENIEILINNEKIKFSYIYKFKEPGKYIIKYIFKTTMTNTGPLFYDCKKIQKLDLSNFNTQYIVNMSNMFKGCNSLSSIDLSNVNAQNVIDMSCMFCYCNLLHTINLSNFDTKRVKNMKEMFSGCYSLRYLDLSNFKTQNVVNMRSMFENCNSLKNLDLSNFNTQNVVSMSKMFSGCNSLTNLNLSNFDTKNVMEMDEMFSHCSSLKSLNLDNFNTTKVENMSYMFSDCYSLSKINLLRFNTINVTKMNGMFSNCKILLKENVITIDEKIKKEIKANITFISNELYIKNKNLFI